MKKLTITLLLFISVLQGFSQNSEEASAIFTNDLKLTGWFIELPFVFSKVEETSAYFPGISAGVIINENLRLGLSGHDFSHHFNRMYFQELDHGKGGYLEGNYGGLRIEPVMMDKNIIHLTFPIVIGGGNTRLKSKEKYLDEDQEMDEIDLDRETFFIISPAANLEINLHRYIRLGLGAGYRFTSQMDLQGLGNNVLEGFTTNFSIKFIKF